MKKKLLSALLAALLVLSMIPFAFAGTATATEPGNVAYLDEANGDDETAELNNSGSPFASFEAAYIALCPEGGTLRIIGQYGITHTSDINSLALHYGMIVIEGNDGDSCWNTPTNVRFWGNVTVQNIRLEKPTPPSIFLANYNPLTMGEGIVTTQNGTEVTTGEASPFYVAGGMKGVDRCLDTFLTIKSGCWKYVFGGNRNSTSINNSSDLSKAANTAEKRLGSGTCYITVEGGKIGTLIGVSFHSVAAGIFNPGGQAYIYIKGGEIGQLYLGSDNMRSASVEDSIIVWTGGTIGTGTNTNLKVFRANSAGSLFYGGSVKLNSPYTPNSLIDASSGSQTAVFTSNGVTTGLLYPNSANDNPNTKLNVLPLRTGSDETVYVSQATGTYYNPGTEAAPVSSLANAYAMLTYTGGTIVLLDDYSFTANELTLYRRFNEPIHENEITVKGVTSDIKLIGLKEISGEVKVGTLYYDISTGLNAWYMHGDTTFENIELAFEAATQNGECNLVANFNHLKFNENVTCVSLRISGGYHVQGMQYQATPYTSNTYTVPYTNGFNEAYAHWSSKSPSITINSATAKVWISAFSRLSVGSGAIAYPGTAVVNIQNGVVSDLYPVPTNRSGATGAAATINVTGGTINTIHESGHASGYGAITDNLDITIGENATVKNYQNMNTAPATFEMKVNNAWSSYLIAKNTYTQANVTTDITADTYRDSIDAVLGFGLKDNGADGVKIRYGAKLKDYIVDDPDFTVKEFGVLIKNANNATALEWFDSDAQLTYQNKVAKKIAYKAGTEMNYYDYNPANGNDVQFYTTLTGISEARYETEYVFRAYMVVTVNGVDQVVYGAESADSAYTIAQRLTSSNETAAKVIDAVENAGA